MKPTTYCDYSCHVCYSSQSITDVFSNKKASRTKQKLTADTKIRVNNRKFVSVSTVLHSKMPGIVRDKDGKGVAEAVQSPPDAGIPHGEANTEIMPQPRQPTSLHGLLQFAMEATKSEDAPSTSQWAPLEPAVS